MVKLIYKPVEREKVSVKIANQIKSLIVEGKLKPGEILPPEKELTKFFNVSRPSLREALNSLKGMGFLDTNQSNRIIIKSLVSEKIFSPLDYFLREDLENVFQLIEVRKAIETWNAYFAAKRATLEDIARIEHSIESMKKVIEEGKSPPARQDADFHLSIAMATHNKIQEHMMFTIWDILLEYFGKYYRILRNEEDILRQHFEIVEAIKQKDSDLARKKIFDHLDGAESRIKEFIEFEKTQDSKHH